uniref:ATP-dependent RNA helicase SUV3 homolog, mitochondrial n=1 Tax=Steinernema glaseri TaxID=37863 RepID=A0A1I7YB81_9BILA
MQGFIVQTTEMYNCNSLFLWSVCCFGGMQSATTSTVRFCTSLTLGRIRASVAAIHISAVDSSRRRGIRARFDPSTTQKLPEKKKSIDELVVPQAVRRPKNGMKLEFDGMENVSREVMGAKLDEFYRRSIIRQMAQENHMNGRLYQRAYTDFRSYCLDASLDAALQVTFSDIINHNQSVDTLFPFFLSHARKVFPHLESIDDLKLISDLTQPHNWYPEARTLHRKIVFHAGPTNSGKTYQALQRFTNAKSGVYCGPLKLLASEVYTKTNSLGVNCDLVTGEERLYAVDNFHPSAHLSSTVEMLSTQMKVDIAVIDEIQMLRDEQRGWAWTRALLGVVADEVHLCGEKAAIPIVQELLDPIGEHVDVFEYERKSSLTINTFGLGGFDNIQDGDCIVCFSRAAIFDTTKKLEKRGVKPAVIYGDLPPGTKLAQAAKFNDPDDPTTVLVATDAIGMGLNLNIQRVIFHSVNRPPNNELIPNYSALQIAGRAGRYGTTFDDGRAMTLKHEDIGILRDILSQPVADIEKVGIAPTFDQIETFSFHLPHASFVNLLDIFVSLCSVTEKFFLCTVDQIKSLAQEIDNIQLPLKVRYTFCTAPINADDKPVATAFKKMARRFSNGQPITFEWIHTDVLQWPKDKPSVIAELAELESDYDVTDLYLWLSLRYPDMFPDGDEVRAFSRQIDEYIQDGVDRIIELLNNSLRVKKPSHVKNNVPSTKSSRVNTEEGDVVSSKRKGKRRSVMEAIRNVLSPEELEELKRELRRADETSELKKS